MLDHLIFDSYNSESKKGVFRVVYPSKPRFTSSRDLSAFQSSLMFSNAVEVICNEGTLRVIFVRRMSFPRVLINICSPESVIGEPLERLVGNIEMHTNQVLRRNLSKK